MSTVVKKTKLKWTKYCFINWTRGSLSAIRRARNPWVQNQRAFVWRDLTVKQTKRRKKKNWMHTKYRPQHNFFSSRMLIVCDPIGFIYHMFISSYRLICLFAASFQHFHNMVFFFCSVALREHSPHWTQFIFAFFLLLTNMFYDCFLRRFSWETL